LRCAEASKGKVLSTRIMASSAFGAGICYSVCDMTWLLNRMPKRKSLHIKGMEHGAPIPNGAVIGNLVFSSAISSKDAETGVLPDDPDE
jgi:hypothetical protein